MYNSWRNACGETTVTSKVSLPFVAFPPPLYVPFTPYIPGAIGVCNIVLFGRAGCGKSQLAARIANRYAENGWKCYYILTESARLHTLHYPQDSKKFIATSTEDVLRILDELAKDKNNRFVVIDSYSALRTTSSVAPRYHMRHSQSS